MKDLENRLGVHVDPTVFVTTVLLWQPGLKENEKGCVYIKNDHPPGQQFKNDEEANKWIEEDEKRFPVRSTATIEKDARVGMPWESMPSYKKLLEEKREQLQREKASSTAHDENTAVETQFTS